MNSPDQPDEARPLRQIKSFVLRQGRLTPGQQKAFDTGWNEFGIDYTGQPLDLKQVFGNEHPVILEIGFGNGDSLAQMAELNPQFNYLGIEVHRPGVGHLLIEIQKRDLRNLRIISHDAIEVLKNCFSDASLAGIQLFFPDPWHKKRHHKRRIVQHDFLNELSRILVTGGFFHAATDWENYAEHIVEKLNENPHFSLADASAHEENRPRTKFEDRGLRLGHKVTDIVGLNRIA